MRRLLTSLTLGSLAAFAATEAQATPTYSYDPSIVIVVPGLGNVSTYGDMMNGLEVTVAFSGGPPETSVWAATGPGAGGASGSDWSLTLAGDSFGSPWVFTVSPGHAVTALTLSGLNSLTVFDVYFDGAEGTPGSGGGSSWGGCNCDDAHVTYSHVVAVGGAAPVGDLWKVVQVDFGSARGESFNFLQDTDNDPAAVPEPGTLLLLGSGISALALRRGRRGQTPSTSGRTSRPK